VRAAADRGAISTDGETISTADLPLAVEASLRRLAASALLLA
jgi:hypothetical protein